jgi:hypothetical protein
MVWRHEGDDKEYGFEGVFRVGQNHTFIGIYGVHTVFLARKSPYIRSYTLQMYGPGQPWVCCIHVLVGLVG